MITVNADDVQISPGANYQFIGTGAGTAPGWRNVAELAGAGLTAAAGVLAVGAGAGLTVNTDDVALTTPGTLTVSSTNTATGSHTHAITTSSNPGAAAAILATSAAGLLTLEKLTISSGWQSTGAFNNFYDVAEYNYGATAAITGAIKIALPKSWSNTMLAIRIVGYQYNTQGSWECLIGGYNYATTPTWANCTVTTSGVTPFSAVRLAHDGVVNCILLGDTSTVWNYPKVLVAHVLAGHSNTTGWDSGWTTRSSLTRPASPTSSRQPFIMPHLITAP